jgi:hypothetical protein
MKLFTFRRVGGGNAVLVCQRCFDSSGDTSFSDKISLVIIGGETRLFCPNCEASAKIVIQKIG